MRNTIKYLDPSYAIVFPRTGIPEERFRVFLHEVQLRGLLIGIGSPEGVVEAQQGQEYMDEEGLAGAVKYIKQLPDILGDRKLGWVAIG